MSQFLSMCSGPAVRSRDGRPAMLDVVDCGVLAIPSGRLVLVDAVHMYAPFVVVVPPGDFRVVVTRADLSTAQDGSGMVAAYVAVLPVANAFPPRRITALPPSWREVWPTPEDDPDDPYVPEGVMLGSLTLAVLDGDGWRALRRSLDAMEAAEEESSIQLGVGWEEQAQAAGDQPAGVALLQAETDAGPVPFVAAAGDAGHHFVGVGWDDHDHVSGIHVSFGLVDRLA